MKHRTVLRAFDPEIPIVRPLLDVWREETVSFCAKSGLKPVIDTTNESIQFTRNRMRNVLIPELTTYNPRFREVVWRSVQSLQLDHALIQEMVDSAWNDCLREQAPGYIALDVDRLGGLPPALQRGLLRAAVERLRPGRDTSFAALVQAARLVTDPECTRADLGEGVSAVREGPRLYIHIMGAGLPSGDWPQMPQGTDRIPIPVPGRVQLSGGWIIAAEPREMSALRLEEAERNSDPFQAWLDADTLPGSLEVRTRRAGERFRPLGLGGHSQKLSDFLVNVKMPQRARERWPLLCSGAEIIWVPGYRPGEAYRLHPASRRLAYFELRRAPGDLVAKK
jgi:tRNA(Ile)-lysidine synthase